MLGSRMEKSSNTGQLDGSLHVQLLVACRFCSWQPVSAAAGTLPVQLAGITAGSLLQVHMLAACGAAFVSLPAQLLSACQCSC